MPPRRIRATEVGPGSKARTHFRLIQAARIFDRLLGGRGLGRIVQILSKGFGKDGYVVFSTTGGRLRVSLSDDYWLTPLLRDGSYEQDIYRVLEHVLDSDVAFIDCGANIGYWSVIASHLIGRSDRVVAIEPGTHAVQQLEENARLTGDRFRVLNAAVWSETGVTIPFASDPDRHSWSSGAPETVRMLETKGFATALVATTTIDEVVHRWLDEGITMYVIKLDLEGGEFEAIAGASETLTTDVLVIYEEHGRQEANLVSSRLTELGMTLFWVQDDDGTVSRLTNADIQATKADTRHGYNYFAARPGTKAYTRMIDLVTEPLS